MKSTVTAYAFLPILRCVLLLFVFSTVNTALANSPTSRSCQHTGQLGAPTLLSGTCLYSDISQWAVSAELRPFTPNYTLWSDGATKYRWIYLPPNTTIDTSDPDHWIFPLGTQFFKEFRKTVIDGEGNSREIRVETRMLIKTSTGPGINAWLIRSYAWRLDQSDAALSNGEKNVLNTGHNIPTEEECVMCHKGNTDGILGFESIQLSHVPWSVQFDHNAVRSPNDLHLAELNEKAILSHKVANTPLPGTPLEQQALGYLHANCGHCHNPNGHAAEEEAEHLILRHSLDFHSTGATQVYRTAVNQPTENFTIAPYIVMGAKHEEMALYQSALFLRMNSIDEDYRMPLIAREVVDYEGLALMHRWIQTLPTPLGFDFGFDKHKKKISSNTPGEQHGPTIATDSTTGNQPKAHLPSSEFGKTQGLHISLQFNDAESIPPVMIFYWPEGKGLNKDPIMDHKEGYFTDRLIVGQQGASMSLKNSDDVGHTIYVKDKRRDIRWQLSYMPPGSEYRQELFWEEDVFVEMRCRLHLYMSAWAGSISTPFYTIVELNEEDLTKSLVIKDFPYNFSTLKVWWPKTEPITTHIPLGARKHIDIGTAGKATLVRAP